MNFDIIIIGSGPGGYVAGIRASQLGFSVAMVEQAEVGGICLNWGCIPTKALLKSAQVYNYAKHAAEYGITLTGDVAFDFQTIVRRSRDVAENMSKGVQFLFRKNKIEVIKGHGKILPGGKVEVTGGEGQISVYEARHIILATGSRARELPNLKIDGKKIIGYRQAMTLEKQPQSLVVIGSGAIGSEFAHFYNTLGTKVTLVEMLPNVVPVEDEDVSKQLERSFKKSGMKVYTASVVESVDTSGEICKVSIKTPKNVEVVEAEVVLSAVGVSTNLENLGLEETGILTERGKVLVDEYYRTNQEGYYAIGDIVKGPALAHVASREGIVCVEKIAGKDVAPVDYSNIPGCTYTHPEVASVGYTEKAAIEAGLTIKTGKFPFTASGKANSSGFRDGFIKVIFDADSGKWLGAHFIGENVTEMIAEVVVARNIGATAHDILTAVHPHPTMSEAVMEAVAAAYGEVIHI
ncbi:MAG TPA: dihydrolipoyl dehydrogenase [Bacteroidales bacterium]|nr:dihydrolipoyl dehydrogenase [Bacteroidales bacterium]